MRHDDSTRQQGRYSNESRKDDQFAGDQPRQRQQGDMGGQGDWRGRGQQGYVDKATRAATTGIAWRPAAAAQVGASAAMPTSAASAARATAAMTAAGATTGATEPGRWDQGSNYGGLNPGRGAQPQGGYGHGGDYGSRGGEDVDDPQHQFDRDYHQWRNEQMRNLDDDYREWRQDRYKKFSDEFTQWRKNRPQQSASSSSSQDSGSSGSGKASK